MHQNQNEKLTITIAGDYYNNSIKKINFSLKDNLFFNSDYNIVNLESPVSEDDEGKIDKTGPNLRTTKESLALLKNIGFDTVTLANNHIMDYGSVGLVSTIDACKEVGLKYLGAGENKSAASNPLFLKENSINVAIINCCENEYSIAAENCAGANLLDTIKIWRQIQNVKNEVDKVILITHSGVENYKYPTPEMVEQFRFFASVGADAVINHHTHCISGYEVYNSVPIFYSLGNFIFPSENKKNPWFNGLIVKLNITKDNLNFKMKPFTLDKKNVMSSIHNENEHLLRKEIETISGIITSAKQLSKKWDEYVRNNGNYIYPNLVGLSRLERGLLKYLLPNYKKSKLNKIKHLIRSQSHREIISSDLFGEN